MKPPTWDDRYQGDDDVYGTAANEFLSRGQQQRAPGFVSVCRWRMRQYCASLRTGSPG